MTGVDADSLPRVSVGLPVRNGCDLLVRAVASLQNQSESNIEIIVSDNCSDDGTRDFIEGVAAKDPRIRYHRHDEMLRVYDNFHFVLAQARGEFFMWAAHDDTRDSNFIEILMLALEADADAVLAFGDLNIITLNDLVGEHRRFLFGNSGLGRYSRLAKQSRLQAFHIYGLWRTAAIRQVPYAYCPWWPDLPMLMAAAWLGTFVYAPGTRFYYLEVSKSNLERVANQDYSKRFSLVSAVLALIAATYRACGGVGGVFAGIYGGYLVVLKQVIQLPGYLYRIVVRNRFLGC